MLGEPPTGAAHADGKSAGSHLQATFISRETA
jgi:hypothetical protein